MAQKPPGAKVRFLVTKSPFTVGQATDATFEIRGEKGFTWPEAYTRLWVLLDPLSEALIVTPRVIHYETAGGPVPLTITAQEAGTFQMEFVVHTEWAVYIQRGVATIEAR